MNAENTYEYTFTWFRKKLAIEETTRACDGMADARSWAESGLLLRQAGPRAERFSSVVVTTPNGGSFTVKLKDLKRKEEAPQRLVTQTEMLRAMRDENKRVLVTPEEEAARKRRRNDRIIKVILAILKFVGAAIGLAFLFVIMCFRSLLKENNKKKH